MKELGETIAFILLLLFVMAACSPESLRKSYDTLTGATCGASAIRGGQDGR